VKKPLKSSPSGALREPDKLSLYFFPIITGFCFLSDSFIAIRPVIDEGASSSKRPISTFSSYNTSTLSKNSLTILSCFVLIDSHFLTVVSCIVISVGILSNFPVLLFFFLTSTVGSQLNLIQLHQIVISSPLRSPHESQR